MFASIVVSLGVVVLIWVLASHFQGNRQPGVGGDGTGEDWDK
jgi:hypothetical protein